MAFATSAVVIPGCCAVRALAISVATSAEDIPASCAFRAEAISEATSAEVTPGRADRALVISEATSAEVTPGCAERALAISEATSAEVIPGCCAASVCCTIAATSTGTAAGSSEPHATAVTASAKSTDKLNRNLGFINRKAIITPLLLRGLYLPRPHLPSRRSLN